MADLRSFAAVEARLNLPHPELVEGRTIRLQQLMGAFVYILRCSDNSYYVGSTRAALKDRIAQHDAGIFDGYTARRRPVVLVFAQEFDRITDAIAAERQLKGWRRAKKEALIRGDFETLQKLSKNDAERCSTAMRPSTSSG